MIRHRFTSPRPDGTDATVLRPSNWNDTHLAPPVVVPIVNASVTWTNMPSAATEFPGTYRVRYDLSAADRVRLVLSMGVAGAAASNVKAQYSDNQSAWSDLTATLACSPLGARSTAWSDVPAGAKADVFIRILGQSGDGVIDPQFRLIQLQVQ